MGSTRHDWLVNVVVRTVSCRGWWRSTALERDSSRISRGVRKSGVRS